MHVMLLLNVMILHKQFMPYCSKQSTLGGPFLSRSCAVTIVNHIIVQLYVNKLAIRHC